jgi:hypothetical protein
MKFPRGYNEQPYYESVEERIYDSKMRNELERTSEALHSESNFARRVSTLFLPISLTLAMNIGILVGEHKAEKRLKSIYENSAVHSNLVEKIKDK